MTVSHVVVVEIEIKSLEALKRACERLGWEFKEGCTKHRWYNRWMDDSPVPQNLFAAEEEYQRMVGLPREQRCQEMKALLDNCDHAIHVPGYAYEIGVFKVGDRYQLSLDRWGDIRALRDDNPLPQAYGAECAKLHFENAGMHWEEWQENGNLFVKGVQYA